MSAPGVARVRPSARQRARSLLPLVLLAVALVVVAVLTADRSGPGAPLDPRSTGPLGTRALADVLQEVGAQVVITADLPGPETSTALLLFDEYDDGQRDDLLAWVDNGGVLVVADPVSPLQPPMVGSTSFGVVESSLALRCDLPALQDVDRVSAPGGTVHHRSGEATGCFPRNDGYWLVASPEGAGTIVTLGGARTLTNMELGNHDNALLAVTLLAPAGEGMVVVLEPPPPGTGEATLLDLVPTAVRLAILQVLLAFGVFVLWRARRLGRPVREATPVEVPGSELVVARGNLLQSSRAGAHAMRVLRDDTRRDLAERLGLSLTATPEQVADAAADRTGVPRDLVLGFLQPRPRADGREEDQLVTLSQAVERIRQAVVTGEHPGESNRS